MEKKIRYRNRTAVINEQHDKALEEVYIPHEKEWSFVECGDGSCKTIYVKESQLEFKHEAALVNGFIDQFERLPEKLQEQIKVLING